MNVGRVVEGKAKGRGWEGGKRREEGREERREKGSKSNTYIWKSSWTTQRVYHNSVVHSTVHSFVFRVASMRIFTGIHLSFQS